MSPSDIESLIAELHRDPQLRDRVRNAILADDFLALPGIVRGLGERVDQLGERVDQLGERVDQLGERVDQLGERVDQLGERVDQLGERVDQLGERLDRLANQIAHLGRQMEDLVAVTNRQDGRLGNLEGRLFELDYRDRLPSRLGRTYEKVRPVHVPELELVSAAYRRKEIGAADWDDLLEIDAAALAFARSFDDDKGPEILVVLELSRTVNAEDVRRVHRRAETLRRIGLEVDGCVDGEQIRPDAKELANSLGVIALVVKDAAAA